MVVGASARSGQSRSRARPRLDELSDRHPRRAANRASSHVGPPPGRRSGLPTRGRPIHRRPDPRRPLHRINGRRSCPVDRRRPDPRSRRGIPDRCPKYRRGGPGSFDDAFHRPRRLDSTGNRTRRPSLVRVPRTPQSGRSLRARTLRRRRDQHNGRWLPRPLRRASRAVRSAIAARDRLANIGMHIRAGVHTAEIVRVGNDVRGIGVHVAARVAAAAGPDEVLVSATTKDLVAGSGLEFQDRGEFELKGVDDTRRLFAASV